MSVATLVDVSFSPSLRGAQEISIPKGAGILGVRHRPDMGVSYLSFAVVGDSPPSVPRTLFLWSFGTVTLPLGAKVVGFVPHTDMSVYVLFVGPEKLLQEADYAPALVEGGYQVPVVFRRSSDDKWSGYCPLLRDLVFPDASSLEAAQERAVETLGLFLESYESYGSSIPWQPRAYHGYGDVSSETDVLVPVPRWGR